MLELGDALASPGDLALVGPYLVLINSYADSAVRVLRAADGALVRSFGRTGEGPREFRGAWSLAPVPGSGSRFWVYDIALQRMTHVDLERDFEPPTYGRRTLRVQSDGAITSPVWIGDTLLVSPGYFSRGGRLAQLDSAGRMLRTVGATPPGEETTPVTVRQQAYQSTASARPDGLLLAVATRHADRIEIYRPDGIRTAEGRGPLGFDPVYRSARRGRDPAMETGQDLRFGYIDVAATRERIYAIYSGRRRKDAPGRANFGEYVHVFDWNGRLQQILRLDAAVYCIAVDEKAGRLYASRLLPEPAILVYALPHPGRAAPAGPVALSSALPTRTAQ